MMDNLISRLFHTTKALPELTTPSGDFWSQLDEGSILQVMVQKIADGKAMLSWQGQLFSAQSKIPLQEGMQLSVQIQKTGSQIILSIVSNQDERTSMSVKENAIIHGLARLNIPITTNVGNKLWQFLPAMQDSTFLDQLNGLALLLKAQVPLTKGTVEWWNGFLDRAETRNFSDLISERPTVSTKLEARLYSLFEGIVWSSLGKLVQDENSLFEFVTARQANAAYIPDIIAVLEEISQSPPSVSEEQLLEQLSEHGPEHLSDKASEKLSEHVLTVKDLEVPNVPDVGRTLITLTKQLTSLVSELTGERLVNVALQDSGTNGFYVQIPLFVEEQLRLVELLIHPDEEEQKSAATKQGVLFHVHLAVTTEYLGSMLLHLGMQQMNLTMQIGFAEDKCRNAFKKHSSQLLQILTDSGYSITEVDTYLGIKPLRRSIVDHVYPKPKTSIDLQV